MIPSRTLQAKVSLFLLVLLAASACAQEPATPSPEDRQRLARLEQQVEQLRRLLKIPGISAVVLRDGKTLWARGFGFADLAARVPMTEHTPQHVASLTKTFAATLVLHLVEEGKLDLDEPVSRYSQDFTDQRARIKHLLSHTSHDTPGDSYRYDGSRFDSLTQVLEKKTGRSFRELLVETFLDPLEMRETVPGHDLLTDRDQWAARLGRANLDRYQALLQRMAVPYRLYGEQAVASPFPPRGIGAAAGLISTVADLAKFDAAIDAHRFLRPETQALAWRPFISNSGQPLPHGLGWFAETYRGQKLIWHYGYWPDSYSATYVKVPEKGLSFILLANSDAASAPFYWTGGIETSAFACSFLRIFLFQELEGRELADPAWSLNQEEFTAQLVQLRKGSTAYDYHCEELSQQAVSKWLTERKADVRTALRLPPAVLRRYVGRYRLNEERSVSVTLRDGRLYIDVPRDFESEMFAESATKFFLKSAQLEVTFVPDRRGRVLRLYLDTSGERYEAPRVEPQD